ncbi:DNA-binding response regulator [Variovorax paradoxus]|uniref:DNA-binding response regulator n=1 Tax=Variovorax paradoxus TaxID=34073 RepID=A0AA91DLI3_VARPD|nr:response regulator transcription factor [Variovorax paradoxus]OAK61494.1 DNA-binding response regulator [Variovorax paradoxus]
MRILLVEDEVDLAQALASALRQNQAVVDVAGSLREAEEAVQSAPHDVIVLDRGLPDGDGLSLVRFLRHNEISTAVLVLTAMTDVAERVLSLDGGADDYLAKPFSMDELMARVRALARRPAVRANFTMTLGQLSFDHHMRQAHVGDLNLTLPRRELLVLETLLEHRGRTVLRETMQDRVYGDKDEIQSNALDTHVSRLRSKLDKAGAQVEIHAIRGVGYLICAATPPNIG